MSAVPDAQDPLTPLYADPEPPLSEDDGEMPPLTADDDEMSEEEIADTRGDPRWQSASVQGASADSEGAFRRSDEAAGAAHETPPPLYGDPEPAPAEEDGEMAEEEVAGQRDSLEPAERQRQQ